MKVRIAFLLAALCGISPAFASSFCVSSAAELTAALTAAQQDKSASHEIRVHTGHYATPAGGWHVDVEYRGLAIAGGYDDGCVTPSFDASLTVLDGHQADAVLNIATTFPNAAFVPGTIAISGLTFENGLGTNVGGLKISDSGPIYPGTILVERNIFRDNVATVYQQDNSAGGLLAATDGPDFSGNIFLVVRGNLFAGNRAPDGAAATLFSNNAIAVSNNTFVDNQSSDATLAVRSAVAWFTFSGVRFTDNIFWNNNPDGLAGTYDLRADSATSAAAPHIALIDNDLQTVFAMPATDQGNKDVDPLFVDAAHGNLRLTAVSPLVDAGVDAPAGGITANDLDGAQRMQGAHIDLGAYERDLDAIFADGFD